jgi:putative membrane protein
MNIVKHAAGLLIAGASFLVSCNDSADNSTNNSGDTSANNSRENNMGLSDREADFLDDVAETNTIEIAYLNAGIAFATDLETKALAADLLTEHVAMDKELKGLAERKQLTLTTIDSSVVVLDLPDKKGLDWDKAWVDEMADEHKRLVRKFERNEDRAKDPDVRNFITKSLPNLRTHLETLRKTEDRLDDLD